MDMNKKDIFSMTLEEKVRDMCKQELDDIFYYQEMVIYLEGSMNARATEEEEELYYSTLKMARAKLSGARRRYNRMAQFIKDNIDNRKEDK